MIHVYHGDGKGKTTAAMASPFACSLQAAASSSCSS